MARAVTINNETLFTTFRPTDGSARSGCEADIGGSRLYKISADRQLEQTDLDLPGIPPEPIVLKTQPPLTNGSNTGGGNGGDGDGDGGSGSGSGSGDDDDDEPGACPDEAKVQVFVAAELADPNLLTTCALIQRTHSRVVPRKNHSAEQNQEQDL